MQSICLITTSHASTHPRLLKEASALSKAGYSVRIVSVNMGPAKAASERAMASEHHWRLDVVDAQRGGIGHLTWLKGSLRQRAALAGSSIYHWTGMTELAISRFHPEIMRLALSSPADLFLAHTIQALPAAVLAAEHYNTKAGIDFEDLYCGMRRFDSPVSTESELLDLIESEYVPRCAYRTAASSGVAEAIARRHGGEPPVVIRNVFPLSERPSERLFEKVGGPLRLYWFSQTIGSDRGLSDVVMALGLLPKDSAELHLRGSINENGRTYLAHLISQARLDGRQVIVHPPEAPEHMISLASQYDVGLALEQPNSENRRICMRDLCTNKVFTYLLAGLALAATSENASEEIYQGAGLTYPHGNPRKLAEVLRHWMDNPEALTIAKRKAWNLAGTQYNWDVEQRTFLAALSRTLQS